MVYVCVCGKYMCVYLCVCVYASMYVIKDIRCFLPSLFAFFVLSH